MDNGKRPKFKLRSETNALGQEMKRWGRVKENVKVVTWEK